MLLVVSHDRYFLDKVVDHCFVLPDDRSGEVRDWQGSFSEYLEWRDARAAVRQEESEAAAARAATAATVLPEGDSGRVESTPPADAAASKAAKPLSAFEERELARLEAELDTLNAEQAELQQRISGFDAARAGYSELQEWTEAADALREKTEGVEERWLALAERA